MRLAPKVRENLILFGVCVVATILGLSVSRLLLQVPENAATIRRICELDNVQSRKTVALWERVIILSDESRDQAKTDELRAYIGDVYKQHDC